MPSITYHRRIHPHNASYRSNQITNHTLQNHRRHTRKNRIDERKKMMYEIRKSRRNAAIAKATMKKALRELRGTRPLKSRKKESKNAAMQAKQARKKESKNAAMQAKQARNAEAKLVKEAEEYKKKEEREAAEKEERETADRAIKLAAEMEEKREAEEQKKLARNDVMTQKERHNAVLMNDTYQGNP